VVLNTGMPRNAATAFVYLNQACDLETPEGCNNAGLLGVFMSNFVQ